MGGSWVVVVTRLGWSDVLSEGGTCGGEGEDGAGVFDGLSVARGRTTRARHSSGARGWVLVEFRIIEWRLRTKYGHCELGEVVHCAAICGFVEVGPRSFDASGCFAEVVARGIV